MATPLRRIYDALFRTKQGCPSNEAVLEAFKATKTLAQLSSEFAIYLTASVFRCTRQVLDETHALFETIAGKVSLSPVQRQPDLRNI